MTYRRIKVMIITNSDLLMKPKERVLKAIQWKEVDRPPVFATLTPHAAKKLSDHQGLPYEEPIDSLLASRASHNDLLVHMGNDCVGIAACYPETDPIQMRDDGTFVNEWGMIFKDIGLYNEFADYTLKNVTSAEEINRYPFPDPNAPGRYEEAIKTIKKYGEEYAVVANLECAIFETAWYLVGLEKMMVDMMMEAEYIDTLLDRIMGVNIEIGKKLIDLGADIIWAGDDFGTQKGMLMDPATFRKYFKPRMKYMFDEFRKVRSDIKLAWHTCGSVVPIIPDFIEIGLDILNPLQPLAKDMDPDNLTSRFGRDLIFFGGIDIQNLLPFSTPEKIKSEVKRIAGIYGRRSGYIVGPAHHIQDDTPPENVTAMFEAVRELTF